MADTIYFVIPCYNEEDVILLTAKKLREKMIDFKAKGLASEGSRILFVDDGSKDKTWRLIEKLSSENRMFSGLKLSHNRGHQFALMAGLMTAKQHADAVISMDADLQDDIDASESFLDAYYEGCDIVYGVRKSRKKDTFFKKATAEGFYKFMGAMGVELVFNHADYRLMSRKALECLEQYKEVNLFLRGIVPTIGLKSTCIYYERGSRAAGTSKYPLKKMLDLAFEGVTSFSVKPIRIITFSGLTVTCVSAAVLLASVIGRLMGLMVTGWASMMCSLWLLGGIEMLSLGVVGEYIGKIYSETKNRPRYFIEKNLCQDENIKPCISSTGEL